MARMKLKRYPYGWILDNDSAAEPAIPNTQIYASLGEKESENGTGYFSSDDHLGNPVLDHHARLSGEENCDLREKADFAL